MKNPHTKMAVAESLLERYAPWLQALSWSIPRQHDPSVPFLCTKTERPYVIKWSEQAIATDTPETLAGGLYHELLHVALDHAGRRNGRDPRLWNLAGDAEIWCALYSANIPQLPTLISPSKIDAPFGLTAEQYYSHLLKNAPPDDPNGEPKRGCGSDACTHGVDPSDTQGNAQILHAVEKAKAAASEMLGKGGNEAGRPVPDALARHWQIAGFKPKAHWSQLLKRALKETSSFGPATSNSYMRRHPLAAAYSPCIVPGRISQTPRVAVVVDTSGSINDADLAKFRSTIRSIVQATGANATLYAADTEVRSKAKSLSRFEAKGGGGTDFTHAVEQATRDGARAVVYLTDGMGGYRSSPNHAPVVWAILPGYPNPGLPGVSVRLE